MTNLSAEQIQIIKTTWEVPKADLEGSGEAILYRYFEKYPHNQQKFASFKSVPLESLKVSLLFSDKRKLNLIYMNNFIFETFINNQKCLLINLSN